jgi:hypothetical protein
MTSTLVSAVIALLIGSIKVLWFIADRLDLQGILGPSIDALGNNRNADAFEPQAPQGGRGVHSSHRPFGLAGPLNISHVPQAVASTAAVKYRHPLQVLLGSGDFSV